MSPQKDAVVLDRLRHLTVAEPDPIRSERVKMRCRARLVEQHARTTAATESRRFVAVVESALAYGWSVGFLSAMLHDLVRIYSRR